MGRRVKARAFELLTSGWLSRPEKEILEQIVAVLVNGGSLLALCQESKIIYSRVVSWIAETEHRTKAYDTGLTARNEWMVQRVLDEVRRIATVDIRDAFKVNGDLKDIRDMPGDLARAIQQISISSTKNGENVTLKFVPKLGALELLGKQVDMFHNKVSHSADESLEALIKAVADRPVEKKDDVEAPARGDLKASEN